MVIIMEIQDNLGGLGNKMNVAYEKVKVAAAGNVNNSVVPESFSAVKTSLEGMVLKDLFLQLRSLIDALAKTKAQLPLDQQKVLANLKELFAKIQNNKAYTPAVLKESLELFKQIKSLLKMVNKEGVLAQLKGTGGKEQKELRNLLNQSQVYGRVNAQAADRGILSFPLFNLYNQAKDIPVFLHLERNHDGTFKKGNFSFSLDVPTENMGLIKLSGQVQDKKVVLDAGVKTAGFKAVLTKAKNGLGQSLQQIEYKLKKIRIRILGDDSPGQNPVVELVA
jgi:hypothetical protein